MRRLVRSSAFRIALAFALALVAATYGVFALVSLEFYRANVAQTGRVLQDEVHGVQEAPRERLEARLHLRLTQDVRHLDYVGLFDSDGTRILGNIELTIPVARDGRPHVVRLPPPDGAGRTEAVVVAAPQPDGGLLVLGRSLAAVDALESDMLHAFAIAIVPIAGIALALGALVSVRASRRLTTIQDAIRRVMGGELDVRLPARGTPDDIDELVRAVNTMLDEIVRLLHQLKSVGDNIAHDLRAPLAVMRARLERGLAGGSEAALRRLTGEALDDLERAMTTVTALLRISELESGLRRSAFDDVDLSLVARDAFELFAPLAEAKGIAMTLAAERPVPIHGDGDLLREALVNLVDNAVKFTPRGGSVRIASGEAGTLVRVADTGPGVAPEERGRIGRRFYRAGATRTTPGHGLGLSMTTTIVELHGLSLRIRDNSPGAVFEIVDAPMHW